MPAKGSRKSGNYGPELRDMVKREGAETEIRVNRINEIESRIYDRAAAVVEAHISFHEVTRDQEEAPKEWVRMYGKEGAEQRLAVARTGWGKGSEAPSGVKVAQAVMVAIQRGRAFKQALGSGKVNVTISLPAPTSASHELEGSYPSKDLEE